MAHVSTKQFLAISKNPEKSRLYAIRKNTLGGEIRIIYPRWIIPRSFYKLSHIISPMLKLMLLFCDT